MKKKQLALNLMINKALRNIIFLPVLITFYNTTAAPNKGNKNANSSCFLNAATQVMFHIKPLRDYLTWAEKNNVYTEGSTPALFINYINEMAENDSIVSPASFRKAMAENAASKNIQEMSTGQHDTQEYFSYIIESLIENTRYHEEAEEEFIKCMRNNKIRRAAARELFKLYLLDTNRPTFEAAQDLKQYFDKRLHGLKKDINISKVFTLVTSKEKDKKRFDKILKELIKLDSNNNRNKQINKLWALLGTPSLMTLMDKMIDYNNLKKGYNEIKNDIIKDIKSITKDKYEKIEPQTHWSNYDIYSNLSSFKKSRHSELAQEIIWSGFDVYYQKMEWDKVLTAVKKISIPRDKIYKIFNLYSKQTYTFSGSDSVTYENALMLSLKPTNQATTLENLIKNFYSKETTEFGSKELKIKTTPQILTIQINRFLGGISLANKNKVPIQFPIKNLNLKDYTLDQKDVFYNLIGIVIHGGGLGSSGHYWAYAKWYDDAKWYYYNCLPDGNVKDSSAYEIANLKNQAETSNDTPYLLIYEKTEKKEVDGGLPSALRNLKNKLTGLAKKLLG